MCGQNDKKHDTIKKTNWYKAGEKMDFEVRNKPNYSGKITTKKYHTHIKFHTEKQMREIYPNKNYRLVGEIGNKTGVQCGTATNLDIQPLPVYKEKTHNRFTENVIGYTAVDDHTYLAVVKNVLLRRILICTLVLTLIAAGAAILKIYFVG